LLSYRHSFHAGNFADVLKHIVVTEILAYLCKKDKPFEYIDTHAGAGSYSLGSEHARKTGEYLQGIARLRARDWPGLAAYFSVVDAYNPFGTLRDYPGSPGFALHYLRPQDRAWLFELHSKDYAALCSFVLGDGKAPAGHSCKKIRVQNADGLAGLQALVPPQARRGLILVDPSYEIKTDYQQVVNAVIAAHRKFATGIYAVWYPVISRSQASWFERKFAAAGIANVEVFELGVLADNDDMGMTSSCMLVINPPWLLKEKCQTQLPRLVKALDTSGEAFCRIETLCPEQRRE
jgi:23S rRNA (adenine2030-N6)-methyltransferase